MTVQVLIVLTEVLLEHLDVFKRFASLGATPVVVLMLNCTTTKLSSVIVMASESSVDGNTLNHFPLKDDPVLTPNQRHSRVEIAPARAPTTTINE